MKNKYVSILLLKSHILPPERILNVFFFKGLPDMNPEMFRQHWCKQIDLGILYYGEKEFKYCSILSKIPPDAAYIAK